MKIALCAKRLINCDITHNLNTILKTLDEVTKDTDLICFGEAFLQGFDSLKFQLEYDKAIGVGLQSEPILSVCQKAKEIGVAIAFGYIELQEETFYSSYLIVGKTGEVIANYRRVSEGWKEPYADAHYREGTEFPKFLIGNKSVTVGLCGDLWDEANVARVAEHHADIVLWPVYLDFTVDQWNDEEKPEYANQAALAGSNVMLVNSLCEGEDKAKGGALYIKNGKIAAESLPGNESILYVEA